MPIKTQRLELRLTDDQKMDIERAAAIAGRTVTDFSVSVLTEEAAEVLRRDHELTLPKTAWDEFGRAIEQPARPLKAFAELLRRDSVFVE
ncbi:DUF1778 domain-containing protein [uncultured Amnibacterium sp.]|uniref:type II toxin-antitoxin system TacA family antitoxin n=1 Tax=uncultured Amnibacterium sp. TaxID=1631851 RepID=UPI0035C945DC